MNLLRTYSELITLPTFVQRFEYLRLSGTLGDPTFGGRRKLNQVLYHSSDWKDIRREVIIRDGACDLGMEDHPIPKGLMVHHMNPITVEQIYDRDPDIFDPEYLITVSKTTHNLIHFGADEVHFPQVIQRRPYDTCPWRS